MTAVSSEHDAPLVRALLETTDPETGQGLSDNEIRDQLIVFMLAGHDTPATTLTYALWQLGRAGALVVYGVYAVQRDPAVWECATEFDPDRFLGPAAKSRDRWQYVPFGAGPRTCIGDHFAMLEASLALATVRRRVNAQVG
jgi:cytochrome P450